MTTSRHGPSDSKKIEWREASKAAGRRASTVDAYSYGFHNVVVEECPYDRSTLSHKVNLFDLHHKYADVMHVEEVVSHLQQLPQLKKWPEFALSAAIARGLASARPFFQVSQRKE